MDPRVVSYLLRLPPPATDLAAVKPLPALIITRVEVKVKVKVERRAPLFFPPKRFFVGTPEVLAEVIVPVVVVAVLVMVHEVGVEYGSPNSST